MEYKLNLIKILMAVLKKKWHIIAVGVITMALGMVLIRGDEPNIYAANSSIYAASYASYQETVQGMNIMRDYVNIIRSRKVADRASSYMSQDISPNEIMTMVWANYESDSKIITLTASSADPALAIAVVNAVADAFIQEIASITAVESVKVLDSAYSARLVTDAQLEAMRLRIIIAAIAVLAVICLIAVLAAFDTRVAFPAEATLSGKIELLGIIPERKI